ncbi:hypothetical protein JI747_010395 [Chryseobacterium sp. RG1]|uniref:Uncharacterized protein n=1 Tax=Chryseobacterium tagetis TaxID=2801334 RepID=A0ABS8A0V6_9FLAO|nr:hypothetical protein [Chryseobacterium tagetis]MCA6067588.1 hypothetical protein [Chryseobacterium tagetis]
MIKKIIISLTILILNDLYSQNLAFNKESSFLPVLKSQLSSGVSGEKNETDYPTYKFTLKDLEATESIISKELEDNGYKKPAQEEFINKINAVFKRIIDPKSESKYLHINFDNKCSKDFKLFKNSNSIDADPYSTYVFKKGLFISDLYSIPELLDYTKNSELSEYEKNAQNNNHIPDVKIYYWKDVTDLKEIRKQNIKTIVARNMYLFNNNKSYATWLVQNDQIFIKNLIKFFGYDKEPKFNEYVINNLNSNSLNNAKELLNYIASKDCGGKLKLRNSFLNSYESIYNSSKNVNDILILKYVSSKIINGETKNSFSNKEDMRILASLANTYDPLFKKYHHDGQNWGEVTILADYRDFIGQEEWNKVKNEYRTNNYYNLPNLKSMIEYADLFDSVGAPD